MPEKSFKNATVEGKVVLIKETERDYLLCLEDCTINSKSHKNTDKIYLYCEKLSEKVKTHSKIKFIGDIEPLDLPIHADPNTTNQRLTAQVDGYFYFARTKEIAVINTVQDIDYKFDLLKDKIRQHVYKVASSSDSASVLYSMITADKSFLSNDTLNLFSQTGTSHLLAVSGLHVNIIIAFIAYILKSLKLKRVSFIIVLCAFLVFYAFFTGFSPSVLRAGIMALAFSYGLNFGARYDSINILGLASTALAIVNSCFCPLLKLLVSSLIIILYPSGKVIIK